MLCTRFVGLIARSSSDLSSSSSTSCGVNSAPSVSVHPIALKSRDKVATVGFTSPDSMRAIALCEVCAFAASSRCESPSNLLVSETRTAWDAGSVEDTEIC